jgi:chromosome segregation ATPase
MATDQSGTFPGDFMQWFVNRFDRATADELKRLSGEITKLAGALQPAADAVPQLITLLTEFSTKQAAIDQALGDMMAKIDDLSKTTGAQIDALRTQNEKALGEIRAALDKALQSQVTPEELAAAVQSAKDAQKAESEAGFDAKVDEVFAPITEKLTAAQTASQALDDVVPDAEPTPAEPNPPVDGGGTVEPPVTPGTPEPTV